MTRHPTTPSIVRLALLVCFVVATRASAGILHLKDGSRFEGEIKKTDDGYRVTTDDGKVTMVSAEKVASIDVHPPAGVDTAAQRLTSMRRAVENMTDIKKVLERYRAFIDQNAGTPAAKEAQQDVDVWRDRLAKGLVKVGTKWVSRAEQADLEQHSQAAADSVRGAMKQGRLKESAAMLDRALADNPQNVSLLYLRGVLHYRQEELPPSRKSFESVAALAADHAPTLNNLAVILWRQNAPVAALQSYDRAMLAAPGSREILDNVAEALSALPEPDRKSAVVKKVVRHFKEQDDDLQKKMSQRGYVRWGATWVTQDQADKLEAQEKEIKERLDAMSRDFDAIQARINTIDRVTRQDQQEMQLLDSQSYGFDSRGNAVRFPLPARYYDLGREIQAMQAERGVRVGELERLRKSAKAEQQKLPVTKYTGIQKLIDVDGMPVLALRPPDTKPAEDAAGE